LVDRRVFETDRRQSIALLKEAAGIAASSPTLANVGRFRKKSTAAFVLSLILELEAAQAAAKRLPEAEAEVQLLEGAVRTAEAGLHVDWDGKTILGDAILKLEKRRLGTRKPISADGALDPETLESLNGVVSGEQFAALASGLRSLESDDDDSEREPDDDLGHNPEGQRPVKTDDPGVLALVASDPNGKTHRLLEHPIDGPHSQSKGKRRDKTPNADAVFQREQHVYNEALAGT
jgi:hypothetical protein